jgi:hypothetical protein
MWFLSSISFHGNPPAVNAYVLTILFSRATEEKRTARILYDQSGERMIVLMEDFLIRKGHPGCS